MNLTKSATLAAAIFCIVLSQVSGQTKDETTTTETETPKVPHKVFNF